MLYSKLKIRIQNHSSPLIHNKPDCLSMGFPQLTALIFENKVNKAMHVYIYYLGKIKREKEKWSLQGVCFLA